MYGTLENDIHQNLFDDFDDFLNHGFLIDEEINILKFIERNDLPNFDKTNRSYVSLWIVPSNNSMIYM